MVALATYVMAIRILFGSHCPLHEPLNDLLESFTLRKNAIRSVGLRYGTDWYYQAVCLIAQDSRKFFQNDPSNSATYGENITPQPCSSRIRQTVDLLKQCVKIGGHGSSDGSGHVAADNRRSNSGVVRGYEPYKTAEGASKLPKHNNSNRPWKKRKVQSPDHFRGDNQQRNPLSDQKHIVAKMSSKSMKAALKWRPPMKRRLNNYIASIENDRLNHRRNEHQNYSWYSH